MWEKAKPVNQFDGLLKDLIITLVEMRGVVGCICLVAQRVVQDTLRTARFFQDDTLYGDFLFGV